MVVGGGALGLWAGGEGFNRSSCDAIEDSSCEGRMLDEEELVQLKSAGVGCRVSGHSGGCQGSVEPVGCTESAKNRPLKGDRGDCRVHTATQMLQTSIEMSDASESPISARRTPNEPPASDAPAQKWELPWIKFERSPEQTRKIAKRPSAHVPDSNYVEWMQEGLCLTGKGWGYENGCRPRKTKRSGQDGQRRESALLLPAESMTEQEPAFVPVLVNSKVEAGFQMDSACAARCDDLPHPSDCCKDGAETTVEVHWDDACLHQLAQEGERQSLVPDSNYVEWMQEGLCLTGKGWGYENGCRPRKTKRSGQDGQRREPALLLPAESMTEQEPAFVPVLVNSKVEAGFQMDSACAARCDDLPHPSDCCKDGAETIVEVHWDDACLHQLAQEGRTQGKRPEDARRGRDLNPNSPPDMRSSCLSAADTAHRSCGESIKAASPDDHTVWTEAEGLHARAEPSREDFGFELKRPKDEEPLTDLHEEMLKNPSECKLVEGVKGHFRIVKKLGSGGFATVYQAYSLKFKRYVALKVFQGGLDLTQCRSEATHLRRIGGEGYSIVTPVNVPDIAPRGGFLADGHLQVLCLPFVEHDDPNVFIAEGLQTHEIRAYLKNLFQALARLHDNGILHRDVKPGNYLFSRTEGRGILIDFGLAEKRKNGGLESSRNIPAAAVQDTTHAAGCKRKRAFALAGEAWRAKHDNTNNIMKGINTASAQPAGGSAMMMHTQRLFRMPKAPQALGLKLPLAVAGEYVGAHAAGMKGMGKPLQVQQAIDGKRKKVPRANQAGTKGWRAPEVLLQSQKQTTAIDIWSVGVVMLCLLSRKYPFIECTDNVTNLGQIMSLRHHVASMDDVRDSKGCKTGRKADKMQEFCERHNLHYDVGDMCSELGDRARARGLTWKTLLEQVCRSCGEQCCHLERMGLVESHPIWDLLDRCMDLDPRTRITAHTALSHSFFQE